MKTAGKRLLTLFLVLLICALLLPVLGFGLFYAAMFRAVGLNYTDNGEEGNVLFLTRDEREGTLFYRRQGKKAAVTGLIYDPDSGMTEFTIPDSYGDYPVVELGGYAGRGAPCPFEIEVEGIHSTLGVSPSAAGTFGKVNGKNVDVIYHDVTLNLGANISEIFADQSGHYVETGGDRGEVHVVRVYFNCDPANRNFYSENGRLYDKKGKLVDGFFWWDEDFGGVEPHQP